jgi:hypothetical protein
VSDLLSDDTLDELELFSAEGDDEHLLEELDPYDDFAAMAEGLRASLADEYADVPPDLMDEALGDVLASLSPAESINFGQVLRDIGAGTASVVNDPMFRQVAASAAPIAGSALGTLVAPGVGTAVGGSLGTIAANALAPAAKPAPAAARPAAAAPAGRPPAAAAGSDPATKALLLMRLPFIQQLLAALAMGQQGSTSVAGVSAPAALQALATFVGEAAADADELMSDESSFPGLEAEAELYADPVDPLDRADSLYETLMESANEEIAAAAGWR